MKEIRFVPRVCRELYCKDNADGEICMELYASISHDPFRNHPTLIRSGVCVCEFHGNKYSGDMLLSDNMKLEIIKRFEAQGKERPDFKRTRIILSPIN